MNILIDIGCDLLPIGFKNWFEFLFVFHSFALISENIFIIEQFFCKLKRIKRRSVTFYGDSSIDYLSVRLSKFLTMGCND